MNVSSVELQLAKDLAFQLSSDLQTDSMIYQHDGTHWAQVDRLGQLGTVAPHPIEPLSISPDDTIVRDALDRFDLTNLQAQCFPFEHSTLFSIRANSDRKTAFVVVLLLPQSTIQNDSLIVALMQSIRNTQKYQREAEQTRNDSEAFIEQITQDFEELTWLRNAHEQLDLGDVRSSLDPVTKKSLSTLGKVLHTDDILFIKRTHYQDRERISIIGNDLTSDAIACRLHLLSHFRDEVRNQTFIVNAKPYDLFIDGFPGIRNCLIHAVSKGGQCYGWLLATNKLTPFNTPPAADAHLTYPNIYQFGTFEAGLMSTAANLLASHAKNVEFLDTQDALLIGAIRAIVNAIDAKDPYTCGHSDRVANIAKAIAHRVGIDSFECERIYMAGLLHDVGKIGVPDAILSKPGKLTDEEYNIVKKHPEIGHAILENLSQLSYVLPGVLYHHEAIDGSGYPAGLKGEKIPVEGRILAVADAYDAMTSTRPYRDGMPSEKAERILREGAGKTWDATFVQGLLDCLRESRIETASKSHLPIQECFIEMSTSAQLMDRIATAINTMATV